MFDKRLRSLRKENKLTMKELGQKLSLAESTISGYENGTRKPDIEILTGMANLFDVSIDYLVGRTDDRHYHDDEIAFKSWAKDSGTGAFFSQVLGSDEEEIEELREIWEIMKKRRQK